MIASVPSLVRKVNVSLTARVGVDPTNAEIGVRQVHGPGDRHLIVIGPGGTRRVQTHRKDTAAAEAQSPVPRTPLPAGPAGRHGDRPATAPVVLARVPPATAAPPVPGQTARQCQRAAVHRGRSSNVWIAVKVRFPVPNLGRLTAARRRRTTSCRPAIVTAPVPRRCSAATERPGNRDRPVVAEPIWAFNTTRRLRSG